MTNIRIGIQTVLLPGATTREQFANAARFGFDAVEVVAGPAFDLQENAREVAKASEESGLPVCAICTHPMHDPIVDDPTERQQRLAALAAIVEIATDLGASGVVSVPRRPAERFSSEQERERRDAELSDLLVVELKEWAKDLPSGGAALFLEPLNRYEASFLNTVSQAAGLARRIDSPSVLALADLFHMNIEERNIAEALNEAGSLLGHVHIADNNRLQPGAGCFDFGPAFRALQAISYGGYVSIECFSPTGPRIEGDPETSLPNTVRFIRDRWRQAIEA